MSATPASARTRFLAGVAALLAAVALTTPGCYSGRFQRIEEALASQSRRADSLEAEHARTKAELDQARTELEEQQKLVRSLRAGSETNVQEVLGRVEQLEARLEEQSQMLNDLSGRARTRGLVFDTTATGVRAGSSTTPSTDPSTGAPGTGSTGSTGSAGAVTAAPGTTTGGSTSPAPSGGVRVDPTAAYDQAVLDFTQGRFPLALTEFRAFVAQYPTSDLADNAQYGVGESYYAQSQYDSALVEYRRVVDDFPQGDKVSAALYKLGITYQKTNRSPEARTAYRTVIEKYPRSGEARLAEERLKEMGQR
ncbi:MAG: tol-pal system protein YbgF [Candidatus Eiseniibacteriota bacterium]